MPQFKVLAWNVENFGSTKYLGWGTELIALMADVILQNAVDVAAICEIRGNMGTTIGPVLATELNNSSLAGNWGWSSSLQFGVPRWEQTLFLWDSNVLIDNAWHERYPIPGLNPVIYYGFPRITKDRPPYTGDFTIGGRRVLISMWHAPNPSRQNLIQRGCSRIAILQELTTGDGGVIMGDFNVPFDDNVSTAGSYGDAAFTSLAGGGAPLYSEQLINDISSLIDYTSSQSINVVANAFSQPYDKFFVRTANNGVTFNTANVEQVIDRGYNGGVYEGRMQAIGTHLGLAWKLNAGHYSLRQAFRLYRGWVSDHAPVVMTVNY